MENIKKSKRVISLLLIAAMLLTMFTPITANAATSINVTYTGNIYSYNSSGGKPTENMHGTFSSSGTDGMIYCAEHGIPTPMGQTPGSSAVLSMTEYTGSNANQVKI